MANNTTNTTSPPVIITTDLDEIELGPALPTSAGSPVGATHTTPPRSAAHLSPSGNGAVPPSPTLTNSSSVHFSDATDAPHSPATAQRSTLALRDNQPGRDSGRETLQVIGENNQPRHNRMSSVGTVSSAGGEDEKRGLQNVVSTGGETLVDNSSASSAEAVEEETKGKKGKQSKKDKKEEKRKRGEFASSRLDPETDTTDPTPFKEKPAVLAMMVDPKSIEELEKIGGTKGLLAGLGVDPKRGLTTSSGGAPRGSDDMGGSGAQWSADLEKRRQIYGKNELPQRKGKSLLQLMWMAFQDKILVLLTIAAVVSLALGIYQASPAGPPHIVTDENCPEGCQVASLEWVEGVAIVVAIVIIVMVGSLTDYQKERQFQKLNAQREDRTVKVIRDGNEQQINTKELVVGDIALLEPGEILPVDGVFLSGHNIRCDESGATGESDAIKKVSFEECIAERDNLAPGGKRKLDCFMVSGAKVLEGVGSYVVISSGTNTFNGRIMMAMQGEAEATPLQVKLNGLAELIVYVGSTAGGLLFLALLIRFFVELRTIPDRTPDEKGQEFIKALIISVVLIVAAVPEGLPLAVTLALAFATNRMTRQNLLVRVLGSCETMANATVVCTDKTGTLTQNVMTVVAGSLGVKGKFVRELSENGERTNAGETDNARDDFSFDMSELNQVASPELQTMFNEAICINSTAFEDKNEKGELEFVGSKTETALLRFAKDLNWADYKKVREGADVVQMIPFSSELKAMGVVVKQPSGKYRLYTKGASEILTKNCTTHVVVNHKRDGDELGLVEFNEDTRENISRTIIFYANQSLRTLAMCYKDFESWPPKNVETNDAGEVPFESISSDLTLIAVTGIEDPLRTGVREAVQQCHRAGVAIKMCTGDNVLTARSIANQCGIFTPGGIVMEGPVFRKLSAADRNEIVPRLQILARSSPEDKKLLVKTLKDQGEVVGVTGDGTNDGPALKLANVGFSMGITGTEVAKTASDIILMDDSFSNIVVAIKTGRCVNDSVRKFVQFQLSVNVAAIILTFVSAIASAADGAILSAVQLLWVNLIMDTFAALALATDPPTDSSLDRKPSRKSEPLINVEMVKMILIQAIYQCIVCFVLHFAGHQILGQESNAANDAELRTLVFNVFVFCQIFNQINCRRLDRKYNCFEGFFKNYWFMGIFLIMCGGQVLIVEVGGAAFQVTRIYGRDWAISIIAGLISFPIGVIVRTLPTEPLYRWLIKMKIYQDPSKLPTITQEEEDIENAKYEYNPALDTLRDNLKTYDTIRGGRIRGSSIVLKSRNKRLREADIQLPTLLTMVPTVIAGTVGAGASWLTATMDPEKMADPASQDPSRSTAELFAGKVQMHPDTDPSDPLFSKFGIDPRKMEK